MPPKGTKKLERRKLYGYRYPDRQIIKALKGLQKRVTGESRPDINWEQEMIAAVTGKGPQQDLKAPQGQANAGRGIPAVAIVLAKGILRGRDPDYCAFAWLLTRKLVAWRNSSTSQEREKIKKKLGRLKDASQLLVITPKTGWHIKEFLLSQPPLLFPKDDEIYDLAGKPKQMKCAIRKHNGELCARFEKDHGQIVSKAIMQKARFELDRDVDEYLKHSGGPAIAGERVKVPKSKIKKQKNK